MSSGANITYASRKRRKPVQKTVKPVPAEGIKSNPSKRHRDRLNTELDRLASLLPFPQDVINKLDKLSVLRLSVSYLRAKSFFDVALKSSPADRNGGQDQCRAQFRDGLDLPEGEFLLQALNGFVLVVTADALVFYASSTIQDYLGFQQSDVIHQSVYELIHTEDRAEFQRQLHWPLNPAQCPDSAQGVDEAHGLPQPPAVYFKADQLPPENVSFMERCFVCRLRCLLDNSSGFLAMNFQGRLKYLHGQNKKGKDGALLPPQLALFAIATPLQPPSILEIRTKNFIFRTKHKLDFTPIGCDAKGQLVLGYTEVELCTKGSGYQFIHAADMLYCAESHIRMIKTGESGMTVFRLLAKHSRWRWVQSNARLIYRNGRPDYIIATQRPLTEEEGREYLQKRGTMMPFTFATGEAVLYEISSPFPPMMESLPTQTKSSTSGKDWAPQSTPSPAPLDGHFLTDSASECSGWQDSIAPIGSEAVWKQEQLGHAQDMNLALSGGPPGFFPDNKNNDLYSIMRNLGIDFDDIRRMQSEEFFRTDLPGEVDFRDIDITDEILTYVQDSLNKSTLLNSASQQQPVTQHLSCMLQECLHLEQQQQLQQHQTQAVEPQHQLCPQMEPQQQLCPQMEPQHQLCPQMEPQHQLCPQMEPQHQLGQMEPQQQLCPQMEPQHQLGQMEPQQQLCPQMKPQHQLAQMKPQQQLCPQMEPQHHLPQMEPQQELGQKMKHMQVNDMFASWNPTPPVPFNCPQQELKHYNAFSDLQGTVQEFPYKSEVDSMPYTQNFAPCNQSVLPQHSKCAQLDFPGKGFEQPLHPTTSNLEDFVTCLQVPENQRHGMNAQSAVVPPQAYYAGAMSMYQCQPGPQPTPVDQMQYNPAIPASQAFPNKFQNRGVLNETYSSELNSVGHTQNAAHLHHPAEARSFPDITPSGFL
ncbi:aryl hydrocarbon receptor isoform X2 [Peromyscus californicus insignis]|uniref:aryl hydrocarbon receptor isoform X2 n=1 Tax=Peromyscus californicus insignis TaxID=564181 RepID=UPI0022A7DE3D|nr:aryl hydrocarbon receptor isoform X2 [Peromyscus californicus insignis]